MPINILLVYQTFCIVVMILTVRDWLNQKEQGNVNYKIEYNNSYASPDSNR
jgi:hypothetical protein